MISKCFESLFLWMARYIEPRQLGLAFEKLQIRLAGEDPRVGAYALESNNPQALCFLIDVFPLLQSLLEKYSRGSVVRLLDIGPAFGAAPGLLSQLYRSDFLGPKLQISVLDITSSRRAFIELNYPRLIFIEGSIEALEATQRWDIVYCSNAIEHLEAPIAFIEKVLEHTAGYAVFLAPYREKHPLSLDHRGQISEETFASFDIEHFSVFCSAAWPTTASGIERQQCVAILRGSSPGVGNQILDH